MEKSKKKRLIVFGAVLVLGITGVLLFRQWNHRRSDTIEVSGNIELTEVNIAFKVSGKLIELNVDEGSPVKKGAVLARLDREQLLRQRDRAQAALASAESQLKLLQTAIEYQKVVVEGQIEQRQAELRQAEANLRDLLAGAREQEIKQARAAVDEAHDGRLVEVEGFGAKRIAGIRDSLATRLGRVRKTALQVSSEEPGISEILDVDREYRAMAEKDVLPKIAPRRFNPKHEAWLPILHTVRSERHYTALFSNTARAHQEGKTHDWVVIYYDGGQGERQCTVITAEYGPMEGRRIVRGREGGMFGSLFCGPHAAGNATRSASLSASRAMERQS